MTDNFWARRIIADNPPKPVPQIVPNGPWWTATPQSQNRPVETVQPPQAVSAIPGSRCPACNSGNYTTVNGNDPRAIHKIKRCFDCGYPVVQSTSGMNNHTGQGVRGTPTRQITNMTVTTESGRVLGTTEAASGKFNNYHPTDTRAGDVK